MYKSFIQDLRWTRWLLLFLTCYSVVLKPLPFFSRVANHCSDYATVFMLHCGFHNVLLELWLASRSILPSAIGKHFEKSAFPVAVIQILMSRMFYDLS